MRNKQKVLPSNKNGVFGMFLVNKRSFTIFVIKLLAL